MPQRRGRRNLAGDDSGGRADAVPVREPSYCGRMIRRWTRRTAMAGIAAGLVLGLCVGLSPAAAAAAHSRRPPVPVVSVSGLPSPRLDQDTTQTMVATGASRLAPVTVLWGDGTGSRGTTTCSRAQAVGRPDQCTVSARRAYTQPGAYDIVVKSGARVVARTQVVVRPAALPWRPPSGWVQPVGWAQIGTGATYLPCSTVTWFYDRSQEPAASVGIRADIEAALALLAQETGLSFAETNDPAAARLTIRWDALTGAYADAAAVGGRQNGRGSVTINTLNWWPTDQWPGFGRIVQPDGSSSIGRGWMLVHETMHAMGMGHVNDVTAIMNPVAGATALNAGDLDGLHTMYLNNPCPV